MQRRVVLPFSAVVGLDKLKLAILINAINPKIGGVLIRGPKGSGKTTLVRALVDILPKITVVKDCPFGCSPHDPSNMCSKCSERYAKGEQLPTEEREMKVVDLPLGATEDRVVGSLDVEKAIKLGVEALEPGILAAANQNILYVDEINLLPDHIADDLLDAAATGWNVVEREGISVSHPSRFIFIGTMNPEEGELRPQLLDRFPLSTSVERLALVEDRIEVVRRNMEFETDPGQFLEKCKTNQDKLRDKIIQARKVLPQVNMPEGLLEAVCRSCLNLKVDGMRPDIVIIKAATTLAAFENRKEVTSNDVLVASELALSHRTREGGFLEPATPDEIKKTLSEAFKETKSTPTSNEQKKSEGKAKGKGLFQVIGETSDKEEAAIQKHLRSRTQFSKIFSTISRFTGGAFGWAKKLKKEVKGAPQMKGVVKGASPSVEKAEEKTEFYLTKVKGIPSVASAVGSPPKVSKGFSLFTKIKDAVPFPSGLFSKAKKSRKSASSSVGKRAETVTTIHRGRPSGWRFPVGKPKDIHLPATIRAAARKQKSRESSLGTAIKISLGDIREKLRVYKAPVTIMFVLDLSGSMILSIDSVKEAIMKLHGEAYRYRDRVGIVALKDTGALVVQHPMTNLRVVANKLLSLRISGFTPLATGMLKAWEVLQQAKRRDRSTIPVMVIITDGSANVPLTRSLETGEVRTYTVEGVAAREYEDLAVRDVFSVSKMIHREGIYTVVVNTNPHVYGRETYGFAVTELIASYTNGKHHIVGRLPKEDAVETIVDKIASDQRMIAHEASLSMKLQ